MNYKIFLMLVIALIVTSGCVQPQQEDNSELVKELYMDYYFCYWAFNCETDPEYCATEVGFTTYELNGVKTNCWATRNYEKYMKEFDYESYEKMMEEVK